MQWLRSTLGSLAELGPQYGANASAVAPTGTRPRYVRITDIDANGRLCPENLAEANLDDPNPFLLEDGDLLFARSGATVGKTYLYDRSDGPCIFAGYLIRFRLRRTIVDRRFAFYFTRSTLYRDWIDSRKRVAAQPNVNGGEYASLVVPLPTLSEQRAIVEILDQADALRRRRAETDGKMQRILPAVFHKMFGDPRSNPKGWPLKVMHELFALPPNYGTMIPPEEDGGTWLSLRVANIANGKLDLKDRRYVELAENMIGRHGVKDGDLLLARAIGSLDHLGKCVVARPHAEKWAFDSHLMRIRFNRQLVEPEFVRGFLTSPGGRTLFLAKTRKSAVQFNINTGEFGAILIPLPPIELQRDYIVQVQGIERIEEKAVASREQLDRLFAVLLHRAFTGDLTASWRSRHSQRLETEMLEQRKALEQAATTQTGRTARSGRKRDVGGATS